ncbi:MAG: glycine cleavage system aminomethyltransferase GcvT [Bacillota bacterium]
MQTPLFPIYQKYQAKVIDFHGWDLPVQFSGIIQEHHTVRRQVGLFDVSHMGEILVEGLQAAPFLDYVLTNRIATLKPGHIRYSPLCLESGGTIDDLLVYCFSETKYLLVVNASNIQTDFDWLVKQSRSFTVSITNISEDTAQLAIQGPNALALLSGLIRYPLTEIKYYQFVPEVRLDSIPALLSRTGYTGEDGFEIYLKPEDAVLAWELLMSSGAPLGIKPVGLGARDTLRFEAGLPLYGNELTTSISPIAAGLERFVKFDKPDFIGKTSLLEEKLKGGPAHLTGLEMADRGIPRSGCRIFKENRQIGFVTSGNYCPSLDKNMAMIMINQSRENPDPEFQIEIRGKLLTAKEARLPFYARTKGGN